MYQKIFYTYIVDKYISICYFCDRKKMSSTVNKISKIKLKNEITESGDPVTSFAGFVYWQDWKV